METPNPPPADAAARDLLACALQATQRRYRSPPLPADLHSAIAAGPEAALAFALEAARLALASGSTAPAEVRDAFTTALAALVRAALEDGAGDPTFQVLVQRLRSPVVSSYVELAARAPDDRRLVRATLDRVAHPGKLQALPDGPMKDRLALAHRLARDEAWGPLEAVAREWSSTGLGAVDDVRTAMAALLGAGALQRLEQARQLRADPEIVRYLALCERSAPMAGSASAAAQGRAAGRTGRAAEESAVQALREAIEALRGHGAGRWHVVRGLRVPPGFPGESRRSKQEWDAAIVAFDEHGAADVLLLAEVKASPAAAGDDLPRLLRGLERLAQVEAGRAYAFDAAGGPVAIAGSSLRRLHPRQGHLPAHVVYACPAAAATPPPVLATSAKAVLLAEPASVAFGAALASGQSRRPAELDPVWDALATSPRLRTALHQHPSTRRARESMLDPADLVEAVRRLATNGPPSPPPSCAPP